MAEGLARAAGHEAESAGTVPATAVHPLAVQVMREVGVVLDGHRPKLLDMGRLGEFDRVITMGCGVAESCPALHTDEDWGLDDPVGGSIETFRATRDEIARRIRSLQDETDD